MLQAFTDERTEKKAGLTGLDVGFRPVSQPSSARLGSMPFRSEVTYGPHPNISNLQGADLKNADLRWQNFRGASLKYAEMAGSLLWGASLSKADLSNADLSHADLTGSDLTGADLTNTKTEGACFIGARYDDNTKFPSDFGNPRTKGFIGKYDSLEACGVH
jgi:uncharacterized protein YjbI with pentapeptide repeats